MLTACRHRRIFNPLQHKDAAQAAERSALWIYGSELLVLRVWVVVKIVVPFWIPIIIRHLIFKGTQRGTIILTTIQIGSRVEGLGLRVFCPWIRPSALHPNPGSVFCRLRDAQSRSLLCRGSVKELEPSYYMVILARV